MKLSTRILLIVASAFGAFLLIVYMAARTIVDEAFAELEENSMRSGINAVDTLYEQELENMLKTALEWASDEAILDIATNGQSVASEPDIQHQRFIENEMNLVAIANAEGALLGTSSYDLATEKISTVPDDIRAFLARDSFLRRHHHALSRISGLVLFPEGPMMVVSVPILPHEEGSLVHGALIMGRWWKNASFTEVMQKGGLAVYQQDISAPLSAEFAAVHEQLRLSDKPVIRPLSETALAAYVLLDNVYGEPGLIVRISRPRQGSLTGTEAFMRVAIIALVAGCAILAAVVLLVELTVSRRMRRLLREMSMIESSDHISLARISVRGKDEIGKIAAGMRYVLSALRVNRFRWLRTEKQLQKTLSATPAGVIFVDQTNSTVTRINQAALNILAAKQEDILAQPVSNIVEMGGESKNFEAAMQRLSSETDPLSARLRRADGTAIEVMLNGCEVRVDQERSLLISFVPAHNPVIEAK